MVIHLPMFDNRQKICDIRLGPLCLLGTYKVIDFSRSSAVSNSLDIPLFFEQCVFLPSWEAKPLYACKSG